MQSYDRGGSQNVLCNIFAGLRICRLRRWTSNQSWRIRCYKIELSAWHTRLRFSNLVEILALYVRLLFFSSFAVEQKWLDHRYKAVLGVSAARPGKVNQFDL